VIFSFLVILIVILILVKVAMIDQLPAMVNVKSTLTGCVKRMDLMKIPLNRKNLIIKCGNTRKTGHYMKPGEEDGERNESDKFF